MDIISVFNATSKFPVSICKLVFGGKNSNIIRKGILQFVAANYTFFCVNGDSLIAELSAPCVLPGNEESNVAASISKRLTVIGRSAVVFKPQE